MRNPLRYFNRSPEVIRLAVMMYIRDLHHPLSAQGQIDRAGAGAKEEPPGGAGGS